MSFLVFVFPWILLKIYIPQEEGIRIAWQKAVMELSFAPGEGLCIQLLNAAANLGLDEIAIRIGARLGQLGISLQEFHFAAMLEATCKAGAFETSLKIVNMASESTSAKILQKTLRPFINILDDLDKVDKAWALVETMHEKGKRVGIYTLNSLLQAAGQLGDLQRAIGIFSMFPKLGIRYTIESFNTLLTTCVGTQHKALGMRLFSQLKELGLQPDAKTFERMINLMLTQDEYEECFLYLEEMKASGFKPPQRVYMGIIKKCVYSKDERASIAVAEMKECGYVLTPAFERFIANGGARPNSREEWSLDFETETPVDEKNAAFAE